MMKNIKKALLGVVVIGGLMFVGCSSNNDVQYKDTDPAVEKYGEELTLNNGEFVINDYMDEESVKKITIERYERAKELKPEDFDTDYEKTMIVKYLLDTSDILPGEEEDDYVYDSRQRIHEKAEANKEDNDEEQEDPYLDHDVVSEDKDEESKKQIGDVPEKKAICKKCGKEFITNQDDDSELCNNCKQGNQQSVVKTGNGLSVTVNWRTHVYDTFWNNEITCDLSNNDNCTYNNVVISYDVIVTSDKYPIPNNYKQNIGSIGPQSRRNGIILPYGYNNKTIRIDNVKIISWE